MRTLPAIHPLMQQATLDAMAAAPALIAGVEKLRPNAAVVQPAPEGLKVIGFAHIRCWTGDETCFGYFQPIGNSGGWLHLDRARVLLFPGSGLIQTIPMQVAQPELVIEGAED